MFARNQDNLLGLSYAEIQKEIFKVINKYYNPKSVVKLSFSDKEDLVWTLIGHIYEQSGKFDPAKGHAVSWMWSVAKNKLNDILKAKCRHIMRYTHIGESDSKESLKINEIVDESSYITQEELDTLDVEVSRLKPELQEILDLYLKGVSEKEIAAKLNMNYNTVRQTIKRIKETLRRRVNQSLLCCCPSNSEQEHTHMAA